MKDDILLIYSFYRFSKINNKNNIKKNIDKYFKKKIVRGTILIANEGINASISGKEEDLKDTLKLIRKLLKIRKLVIKINRINYLPFNRIKVRLKKEIVSLGKNEINIKKFTGKFIHPSNWNKLIEEKNLKLIDVRNFYEVNIGQFKKATDPETTSFREFPEKFKKIGINKNDKIAMYCTGGIRCEKASAYLKLNGFNNVSQLQGGILNYLKYINEKKIKSFWKGECFVFDDRVTVDKNLIKGKYLQCHGCRQPITIEDTKLKSYRKGVSCRHCHKKRSEKQKKRSLSRQDQINLSKRKGIYNPFQKIKMQEISS